MRCLSHRRGPPTQASRGTCEDIVTISDRAVANGRGRQVQPNASAAGLLRGTVAAENACRAHNEARRREARGKPERHEASTASYRYGVAQREASRNASGRRAVSQSASDSLRHTRDANASPILKPQVYPLPHPHQRALHIRQAQRRRGRGSAPVACVQAVRGESVFEDARRRDRAREAGGGRGEGRARGAWSGQAAGA